MNLASRTLRLRWTSLVETGLFLLVVVTFGLFVHPDRPGYIGIQPHPFWGIVLLMALRYPLRETLACAVMAAAVFVGFTIWGGDGTYVFSAIDLFSEFRDPVLFVIVAGIIATFTQRQLERHDEQAQLLLQRDAEVQDLQTTVEATSLALRELETRITGEFTSILDLFQELSRTRQMSVPQIKAHLLDVLSRYVDAGSASFYEVADNRLVRRYTTGALALGEQVNRRDDMILDEALRSTEVVHLGHFASSVTLESFQGALLAGCLRSPDFRVLGVVAIESISFVDYNPHTFKLFGTIVDWWSTVLEEQEHLEALRQQSVFDEEMGLYNQAYFASRLRQEFERARRFSLPMCLGLLRIDDFDRVSALQQGRLKSAISGILREHITELEMAAHYHTPDVIAVSFPIADADDTRARLDAAVDAVHQFYFTPYAGDDEPLRLTVCVVPYEIGMSHADELTARGDALLSGATTGDG